MDVKPDAAMVYAALLIKLQERHRSPEALKRALSKSKRVAQLRSMLTDYELAQAHNLANRSFIKSLRYK